MVPLRREAPCITPNAFSRPEAVCPPSQVLQAPRVQHTRAEKSRLTTAVKQEEDDLSSVSSLKRGVHVTKPQRIRALAGVDFRHIKSQSWSIPGFDTVDKRAAAIAIGSEVKASAMKLAEFLEGINLEMHQHQPAFLGSVLMPQTPRLFS
ncbi:hypothetical protein HC256_002728 [Beauveria bassiana]|nr:hypothetical protein HC256_002728 [Beauveria bassiana]